MDRLEAMIDDHGKELESLKNKMMVVEKAAGSIDTLALKADIDKLEKGDIPLVHHSKWMKLGSQIKG